MKIAILGYVGSGKSVLARNLSRELRIPKLELDDIAFDLSWNPIDRCKILPEIQEFMLQDHWIIDGNYDDLLQEERLSSADFIVFVNLPRFHCLIRALRRTKERKAAGYQRDINMPFLRYLLFGCRNPQRRNSFFLIQQRFPDKCVVLRSQNEIDAFLFSFLTKFADSV